MDDRISNTRVQQDQFGEITAIERQFLNRGLRDCEANTGICCGYQRRFCCHVQRLRDGAHGQLNIHDRLSSYRQCDPTAVDGLKSLETYCKTILADAQRRSRIMSCFVRQHRARNSRVLIQNDYAYSG